MMPTTCAGNETGLVTFLIVKSPVTVKFVLSFAVIEVERNDSVGYFATSKYVGDRRSASRSRLSVSSWLTSRSASIRCGTGVRPVLTTVSSRMGMCPQTFETTMCETVNSARQWLRSASQTVVVAADATNGESASVKIIANLNMT